MSQHEHGHGQGNGHSHHILSEGLALKVLLTLLFLTVVTVVSAQFDFGALNFPLAMLIASVKGALVCLIFMGLKYDAKENSAIFFTSFIFMGIFLALTFSDLLTRGDVHVKGPLVPQTSQKSKFTKAWVSTPELVSHGKEVYQQQCVVCHGAEGNGQGPAAAGLNPKPRDFTQAAAWINGRKPTQIFQTLTKGLNTMPAFGSMSTDDRWALVHFVRQFGPHESEKDTAADFAKAGIDPNSDDGGAGGEKSIPVGLAIDQISED